MIEIQDNSLMIAAKSARAGAAVRSGVQMTRTNWCKCSVSRRRGCGQKFLFTWRRGCNYHDKIGSEPTEGGRSCALSAEEQLLVRMRVPAAALRHGAGAGDPGALLHGAARRSID